ncbi:MAG: metallopeptidase TldD-related protein [Patescibacteria group bacterium]
MRNFLEKLTKQLKNAEKSSKIKRYRITVGHAKSISSGASNIDFRGGYFPTNIQDSVDGRYLFQWPDNTLSKGYLGRASINNFSDFLKEARDASFEDSFGDNFPGSTEDPNVKTHYQSVLDLYQDPEEYLQTWLERLSSWQDLLNPEGSRHIGFEVTISEGVALCSEGLNLESASTLTNFLSSYDDTLFLSGKSRKALQLPDVKEKKAREEKFFKLLKRNLDAKPRSGEWRVIFHPHVFQSLFFSLFLPNFSGSRVLKGESCFSIDDYKDKVRVFREDIEITTDPTKDGRVDSYNFTGEALPSKKTTFVKNGRLMTPVLTSKYARKAEMETTAKIKGYMDGTRIKTKGGQDYDSFTRKQDSALLIYLALGMHAQEPITGNYSLPCPYAILIEDGEMVGNAPCVVNGNIFSDFNAEQMQILDYATEAPPAFATKAKVTFST